MRALSGGNRYTLGGKEAIGPRNNEWDTILDKNEEYIKNADMFSWVQDECENEIDKILTWRTLRGYNINGGTVRTAGGSFEGNIQEHYGFRPVLELPNVETLGTDGLKAVTLDLNGGSVNGSSDEKIQIIVKKGAAFIAPASEGLVGDTGYLYNWLGSDGKTYQPGDSVPAGVTSLTAQWGKLSGEIRIGTHKWNKLLTDVTFDLFFKKGQSVEITASDKNSGNVTIAYLASDKKLTDFKQMAFLPYSGELHIGDSYLDKDGRYIIYARLSDASGNVRYISSDGIVVDHTAPVISGITDGKIYCEAQIVSVEEANLDNITVNGNPVTLTDGKCTLNPADGEQNVFVTDKAGNTASVTVTVNDGHTPLADDNDCTTPVLCRYCNAVITAAKQHDFTGALQSDETGHWHQCQNEGCTVCEPKTSHTGNPVWETTEKQHTKKYSCCGYVTVETVSHQWENGVCTECGYVCAHSGGSATCTEKAVCDVCGQAYGALAPDNHTGKEEWIKTATEHTKKWMCCGVVTVKTEVHTWKGNICEKCGYKHSSGNSGSSGGSGSGGSGSSGGSSSSSSGGSYNPVQKPEIIIKGGSADLEKDGTTLVITPDEGMTISKVTVNGKEVTVTDNKITGTKAGDKIEVVCTKIEPAKEELSRTFKEKILNLKITVRTTKTTRGNIKVTVKDSEKLDNLVKDIEKAGYTVKYKFYKSTKKASKYSAAREKTSRTYINTAGKKGRKYFYKAKIMIYDRNNKLIASSELKQCKYGARLWTK